MRSACSLTRRRSRLKRRLLIRLRRPQWRPTTTAATANQLPKKHALSSRVSVSICFCRENHCDCRLFAAEFENDTALYELTAVVSHRGRDADGGHYVAWIKEKDSALQLFVSVH